MSRIIKAYENELITPFDFKEIGAKAPEPVVEELPPVEEPVEEAPPEPEPEPEGPDPLQVLEETIQRQLAETEATIQKQLAEAKRRAEEMEKDGYEKGYSQGLKDGTEFGKKSMLVAKEQFEKLKASLGELPRRIMSDYREWFIETCLGIARQVIRIEAEAHPEALLHVIRELLEEVEEKQAITIFLNPKDLEALDKHADKESLVERDERTVILKPDPDVERGGCRMENDVQLIDASLGTRLAMVEEALRRNVTVVEHDLAAR